MISPMQCTKLEQNQMKSIITNSYNKLYSQFMSEELTEVGNYKIIRQIGEGSFGKVYLACHKPTRRKVVLKTSDKNDPNVVREVFYHRQFDYLYITKLYEVIVTETKVWMVLEYCPGKELYEHLLSMHRIPLDESARLFSQIVGAVYYAHSLNCVHRDLKLENILLDKRGNAKLTDFGFTRECVSKNLLETICGTTVYMAPELSERKNYDGFKIDIWSLGVILYTMINGSMPFDEDDEVKTKWKIVHEMPVFNDNIISADAKDLITQLLAKNPSERPSIEKILLHPFLQPYGPPLLDRTEKILRRQRRGSTQFHSKIEKKLLTRLKQSGFNTQAIKASIRKRKCDSLSGLWLLLMEREKASEKQDYPKRSRSVLSVRKVFDTSSTAEAGQTNENFLGQQLNSKKSTPLSRIMSKKSDSGSLMNTLPTKKLDEPSLINQLTSYGSNPVANSSSTGGNTPKKNNIFTKVSKFFKHKKNTNENGDDTSGNRKSDDSRKSHSTSTSGSVENTGIEQKKRANRSESLQSVTKSSNQSTGKDQDAMTLNSNKPFDATARNTDGRPKVEQRQLKRLKSTTSSDISRQTSAGNYDTESMSNKVRPSSNDNTKSHSSARARPVSGISQQSEISNETFNSEYSTDGNTSSLKVSDSTKTNFPHANAGGASQYSTSSDKINPGNSQKFARRDLSIMSSASSTSERSSRTDSFYDITTASSPMIMDVRNIKRSSIKDSVLPRFGTQRSWLSKRSHGSNRRTSLGRRRHGRDLLKHTSAHPQSIIQEESSSGGDDDKRNLNDLSLSHNESLSIQDENELAVHSDIEAPTTAAITGPVKFRNNDSPKFMFGRSLSEGSEWSHNYSELRNGLEAAKAEADELSAVADQEDNSSD